MSKLTDFYLEEGVDADGRKILTIWAEDDGYFELCHNYIQWLFPLKEQSNFNPDAPLLTDEDIQLFKVNPILRINLLTSLARFLQFLGLSRIDDGIIKTVNFEPLIWRMPNHNWFRITRVLKSLMLLGLEEDAKQFFNFLKDLHEIEGYVSDNSFNYWKEAVNGVVEE